MLHEVFYWVLNMSIIASFFGLLIYLLRFIKGIPKSGIFLLWGIVWLRLVCPVGISSKYSLLTMISKVISFDFIKTIALNGAADGSRSIPELTISNTVQAAAAYNPFTYKTKLLEYVLKTASVVWIVVAAAGIFSFLIMYCLALKELKKANLIQDNIYEGTMVTTPTVYGIRKPKIILPPGIAGEHLDYILAHENVHIKRHDNIWRMLAILTACLHWFNPLVWLFLKNFLEDSELSCDERAIRNMNLEERKNYARILLTYSTTERMRYVSTFGSSKVKVRIKNVVSYKKLTLLSSIFFAGLMLAVIFILLTNAEV
jgi:beta-lactamase regulating signal transducer with metallopeptidase domain